MMTSFEGVDLRRNNFTCCLRVNGEERKIGKCEIARLKGFAAMLGENTTMAVEATGNTFMLCRSLKAHAGRLMVVNPSQFKIISMSTKKTDKHDAKVLADDTVYHGRITKNGSKIARTALVQCELMAKRDNPYLNAFHESVKNRGEVRKPILPWLANSSISCMEH